MSAIKSLINEILIKSFDISKSKSKSKRKKNRLFLFLNKLFFKLVEILAGCVHNNHAELW